MIFYDFWHIFVQCYKIILCKEKVYIIFIVYFIGSMNYFVFNTFYLKLMLKMAPFGYKKHLILLKQRCLLIKIDTHGDFNIKYNYNLFLQVTKKIFIKFPNK